MPVRVLVAPSEMKGTLTAAQAAEAIARGVRASGLGAELDLMPLADGGPGTLEAWLSAGETRRLSAEVADPLGRRVGADLAISDDGATALVEMAQASGLWRLTAAERDPLRASTRGTGELILAALEARARTVIVGHGGSATLDAGVGALAALGFRFLDAAGHVLPEGGTALARLARIERSGVDPRLAQVQLIAAVDVEAPLLGPSGAALLFGAQKGADAAGRAALEAALSCFAQASGSLQLASSPGAGAAGGLAFGLSALLKAQIVSGFEVLASHLRLDERIARADVVLTGEGRLDAQSVLGKGPVALARRARRAGKRVVAFVGSFEETAAGSFDEVIVAPGDVTSAADSLCAAAARWASGWR